MSDDQVAKLAARIEVLTGAVQFLLAERIASQPAGAQGELLHILQRAFSTPPRPDAALLDRAVLAQADLAAWMPAVAADLMDEVRRQIGRDPEAVAYVVRDPDRARSGEHSRLAARSEVAEGPCREHARVALAHLEGRRSVA